MHKPGPVPFHLIRQFSVVTNDPAKTYGPAGRKGWRKWFTEQEEMTPRTVASTYTRYYKIRKSMEDDLVCRNCGKEGDSSEIEAHHIIPVCVGGSNEDENLVLLCKSCHVAVHRLFGDEAPPRTKKDVFVQLVKKLTSA